MSDDTEVVLPTGAVDASEWIDVGCSSGAWRSITGRRRGVPGYYVGDSPVGPHFVEAHGVQDAGDGSVSEACVRAQIDAWNLNRHEHWDTMLTPAEARQRAIELRGTIAELSVLAEAFDAAADEVGGWEGSYPNSIALQ